MSKRGALPLLALGLVGALGGAAAWANQDRGRESDASMSPARGSWGITPQVRYVSETASNAAGGERRLTREAGELAIGASFDMKELFAVPGGMFQATLTWRHGTSLVEKAGLDTLELVQENYGRGHTVRLTQFWYQQAFGNGRLDVKLGRLTAGEDFAAFSCDFMNLSFCGARPGSVVSDYWFNWPVSQWGMRLRYGAQGGYSQIGVLEVNPRNLEERFTIGHFNGATGALIPVEAALTAAMGSQHLPGIYKLGGWYDTSVADDVLFGVSGSARVVSGQQALQRHGRYGIYAQMRQQLTGRFEEPQSSGLSLFLNVVQADRRTSRLDRQITVGLIYADPFKRSAKDQIGLAAGKTCVNRRAAAYELIEQQNIPVRDSEYLAELSFLHEAAPWLLLQPNVQYIVSPGGHSAREDVVVIGLRTTLLL